MHLRKSRAIGSSWHHYQPWKRRISTLHLLGHLGLAQRDCMRWKLLWATLATWDFSIIPSGSVELQPMAPVCRWFGHSHQCITCSGNPALIRPWPTGHDGPICAELQHYSVRFGGASTNGTGMPMVRAFPPVYNMLGQSRANTTLANWP